MMKYWRFECPLLITVEKNERQGKKKKKTLIPSHICIQTGLKPTGNVKARSSRKVSAKQLHIRPSRSGAKTAITVADSIRNGRPTQKPLKHHQHRQKKQAKSEMTVQSLHLHKTSQTALSPSHLQSCFSKHQTIKFSNCWATSWKEAQLQLAYDKLKAALKCMGDTRGAESCSKVAQGLARETFLIKNP